MDFNFIYVHSKFYTILIIFLILQKINHLLVLMIDLRTTDTLIIALARPIPLC